MSTIMPSAVQQSTTHPNSESLTPATTACTPFDDLGADVILRSKGSHIDFYVYQHFLSYASPFFRDLFSSPQIGTEQDMRDGKPMILVEEDEETLATLLRYCYPHWSTAAKEETLAKLLVVFNTAAKYQMEGVERCIRKELVAARFLEKEPLRMYAITLSLRLEPEARLAARASLRLPILGRQYFEELEHITAGAHHRLQEYHLKCAEVARKVATNLDWMTSDRYVWFECNAGCKIQPHSHGQSPIVTISGNRQKYVWSRWWWEYVTQVATLLAERPSGTTVLESDLMDDALGKASGCAFCRGRAFKEMREFSSNFAAEVDKATARVVLKVKI